MTYKERIDGRKFDETRPIEAKVGVIKRADGSAMFKIGNTWAYAAVYGPRNLHSLLAFSCHFFDIIHVSIL